MLSAKDACAEPYRATKLWNEAVKFFRSDMPTKKHWHQFKIYQDTFTAAEAVDWLNAFLVNSPNFGPQVTRSQTIQLLRKFLKNHVIEDVFGKWGTEDLEDDKRLYKFPVGVSPSKAIRQPLALLSTLSPRNKNIQNAREKFLSQSKDQNNGPKNSQIATIQSPADIWKGALISNLQKVLHLTTIEEILLPTIIHSDWLLTNATRDDMSLVKEHGMPYWIISAMQCLANWPNSESSGLPNYPGFEKDVFEAVCGYFQALIEPLLTFNLYQLFINIWIRSEMLERVCTGEKHDSVPQRLYQPKHEGGDRVETLRRKLIQAQIRHENRNVRRHRTVQHGTMKLKPLNCHEDARNYQSLPRPPKSIRHSMHHIPEASWKLDDMATRQTWAERFSSVHALHNLSEEDWDKVRESTFGSLPELRAPDLNQHVTSFLPAPAEYATLQKKRVPRCEDEHPYGSIENLNFQANLDCAKSASVEDLLLDMSHRLQSEMEFALMQDEPPQFQKPQLKVTTVQTAEDEDSPLYRPMKPYRNWKRSSTRGYHESSYRKNPGPSSLVARNKHIAEENIYMEMLPKTPLTTHPCSSKFDDRNNTQPIAGHGLVYASYGTIDKARHNAATTGIATGDGRMMLDRGDRMRRTLKPTHEELENQLMCSHIVSSKNSPSEPPPPYKAAIHDEMPTQGIQPAEYHPEWWVGQNPHVPTIRSRDSGRSDIVARYEVPPPGHEKKPANPHQVCDRLTTASVAVSDESPRPQSPLTMAFDSAKRETSPEPEPAHHHFTESIQICLLLIPPQNRSRLRLLLRLMLKMCENPHLVDLHEALPTRDFILRQLSGNILSRRKKRNNETSTEIEEKIINYLLDHAEVVFSVPADLKKDAEDRIAKAKVVSKHAPVQKRKIQRQATFCHQVTVDEYERQKTENLQTSLKQLLRDIVGDENMSVKDKKKRLKQFQKKYPDIYKQCYPDCEPNLEANARRRKPKLSNAIQRLRSLRL